MLFKVSKKDFFIDNKEAGVIPAFESIGSTGMKYISLVYDYESPLRMLQLDERKRRALEYAGFKPTPKGRPSKIEKELVERKEGNASTAIRLYLELQFDADKDLLQAYNEQIEEFKDLMRNREKSDKQLDQALKISKELPNLLKIRDEIKEILNVRADVDEFVTDVASDYDSDASEIENFLGGLKIKR